MRKIIITVYSVFLIIILANYFYYKNLYNKQITYIVELLDRQVQIVGLTVDSTNNGFINDLKQMNYSGELALFFTNPDNQRLTREKDETILFKIWSEFIYRHQII